MLKVEYFSQRIRRKKLMNMLFLNF